MTTIVIVIIYLGLLVGLGIFSARYSRGTAADYFVASHSIGPFLLLMSVFGTTMTAFAMVGSTGEAYVRGIGVYGLMASWSGLVHSAVFFLVGIKLWSYGKKYGYVTQCQFFRDRFESNGLGYLLFPILVALVIPYLLVGIMGASSVMTGVTRGALPEIFPGTNGSIPPWLTGFVVCSVVLTYVFLGGLRAAAWANAFQTVVFMIMGCVAFYIIADALGGMQAASQKVLETHPEKLIRGDEIPYMEFLSYCFVPLSVGMFPHLFQNWLSAKSAKTFRLTVIAHPIFILIVWIPCILIGIWATSAEIPGPNGEMVRLIPETANPNAVLGIMVGKLADNAFFGLVAGLVTAGILAAIMSSLDSQFMCLGTMFTNDIVFHAYGKDRFTDAQKVLMARVFIVLIVVVTYICSLSNPARVFTLGVWCFSGFGALFPLVFASIYWRRVTKMGAYACILGTAISWFVLFQASGYGEHGEYKLFGMMPVAVMFFVSVVSLVGVSLVTQPPSKETIEKFIPSKA